MNNRKKEAVFVIALVSWATALSLRGQEAIPLQNPSFEKGEALHSTVPEGWINMGAPQETPPDIQPGAFGVTLAAQDGDQYLGLVVRDNNTWEGIGQKLEDYLKKDSTYTFSLYLGRSNVYQSISRASGKEVNYNAPTILKIWGVNTQTLEEELLAESSAVSHSRWTLYSFTLKPTVANFDEIDLMAYYAPGHEQKNGNLLIDNCSAIQKTAAPK